MVFHRAGIKYTKLLFNGNVSVHSDLIEQVYHTMSLGFIIDPKLNWSEHVKHIVTKVSKEIGIINKAKQYKTIGKVSSNYIIL